MTTDAKVDARVTDEGLAGLPFALQLDLNPQRSESLQVEGEHDTPAVLSLGFIAVAAAIALDAQVKQVDLLFVAHRQLQVPHGALRIARQ